MMRRGLVRTAPDREIVRVSIEQHPKVGAALKVLRGNADMTSYAPAFVANQGQSDTCFIHSLVWLKYVLDMIRDGSAVLGSPLYGAQITYAEYRAAQYPAGNFPSSGLTDAGAQLDDVARFVAKWGMIRFGTPEQSGCTDVPATIDPEGNTALLPELTVPALETGTKAPFGGEYDVPISVNAGDLCAAALEAGIPIWIGGEVGQNLQDYVAGEIEQPPASDDPTVGGHARGLLGYKTVTTNGMTQRLWRILNSWGNAWGDAGYSWAAEEVLVNSATSWSIIPLEATA
jgi:Papain family cysteine protease